MFLCITMSHAWSVTSASVVRSRNVPLSAQRACTLAGWRNIFVFLLQMCSWMFSPYLTIFLLRQRHLLNPWPVVCVGLIVLISGQGILCSCWGLAATA